MAESEKAVPLAVSLPVSLIAEIDRIAADVKDSRSGVMRRAIRAGLPLVKSGGEVVRLSGELADLVGELAVAYKRSRENILAEAVQRGIRAVNSFGAIEEARANGMNEAALAGFEQVEELDRYPEKRAVRQVLREKGALQIQLDDLLQHCPEARERKETIERLVPLARQQRGAWPNMWGSGVSTAELKRQLAELEAGGSAEAAPAAGTSAARPVTAAAAKSPKRKAGK